MPSPFRQHPHTPFAGSSHNAQTSEWAFEQRNSEQARKGEESCWQGGESSHPEGYFAGQRELHEGAHQLREAVYDQQDERDEDERRRNFEAGPEGRFCDEARYSSSSLPNP